MPWTYDRHTILDILQLGMTERCAEMRTSLLHTVELWSFPHRRLGTFSINPNCLSRLVDPK
jgi:hypothetical protein